MSATIGSGRFVQAAARRPSSPRRARSGCRTRPARRTRKIPAHRIEAVDRQPIGREAPQARPAALDPLDRPVDHLSKRSIAVATSISSGAASHGSLVDFVMRAEPDRPVALALEIESAFRIVDQRQVLEAASGRRAAGPSCGDSARCPSGATRAGCGNLVGPGACRVDEHGCAQLSNPSAVCTCHPPRFRRRAIRARACVAHQPPARRNWRR